MDDGSTPLLDPIGPGAYDNGAGKASSNNYGNGGSYGAIAASSSSAVIMESDLAGRDEYDDLNDDGDFFGTGIPSPLSPPSQVALGKHPHQHRGSSPVYEKEAKCSVRQTVYNIVNMYIGMVILSIHYGVALGGWLSIIELLALVWLGVYTAKILMASFVFVTRGAKMPTYGTS